MPNDSKENPVLQLRTPIEWRKAALLELRRRRLIGELAEIVCQYQQLSREIELKGIPRPW